jgi:hypothetical protein
VSGQSLILLLRRKERAEYISLAVPFGNALRVRSVRLFFGSRRKTSRHEGRANGVPREKRREFGGNATDGRLWRNISATNGCKERRTSETPYRRRINRVE